MCIVVSHIFSKYMFKRRVLADHNVKSTQISCQGFIISGSSDGGVKFWKKQETGIEFIKQFRAHASPIEGEPGGSEYPCI